MFIRSTKKRRKEVEVRTAVEVKQYVAGTPEFDEVAKTIAHIQSYPYDKDKKYKDSMITAERTPSTRLRYAEGTNKQKRLSD